jgi:beta-glucosidase
MKVGPAENMPHALPVIDSFEGRYDDGYLTSAGKDAPKFTDGEMKIIGSPLDFIATNVYIPTLLVMASDQPPGYKEIPWNVSHPKMFSVSHRLAPESRYCAPRLLYSFWKPKEIDITENGCAASDVVAEDGNVYDSDRVMYLRASAAGNGRRDSAEGQFLLERDGNLEWTGGFGTRFGLVYVDFNRERVHPLNVSFTQAIQSVSRWGSGSKELVAAMKPANTVT